MDSSDNINICLPGKKIKGIFGISADKIKKAEDVKLFENKIKFKLCCVYILNKFDKNGNVLAEDFNFITQNKLKEINLTEIKKYFKLSSNK